MKIPKQKKGFGDVAYHFVIDTAGNIYQGRPLWAVGETETDYHPRGHLLICLMGDFEKQHPEAAQVDALVRLLSWASQTFRLSPDTIEGHRDHARTNCPGQYLHSLIKNRTIINRVKASAEKSIHRIRLISGAAGQKRIVAIRRGK